MNKSILVQRLAGSLWLSHFNFLLLCGSKQGFRLRSRQLLLANNMTALQWPQVAV